MAQSVARIVIDGSTYSFDKFYDYIVPVELSDNCLPGCRVIVPFGRGNTKKQGMVISLHDEVFEKTLKSIISVVDKKPVLNDEMLKLVLWLKENTFCTYFDAVRTLLPTGLGYKIKVEFGVLNADVSVLSDQEKEIYNWLKNRKKTATAETISKTFGLENAEPLLNKLSERGFLYKETNPIRKIGDATVKMAQLTDPEGNVEIKLTSKQREVVELLKNFGTLSVKEITYFTGVGNVVISNLEKYGVIRLFQNEIYRSPALTGKPAKETDIALTNHQAETFDTICELLDKREFNTVLMHGVTGSGKTQVFLKLVKRVVGEGRGVIVMVPEIALTPQMLDIFYSYFGKQVAVFHSGLPLSQRLDEWKRIKNGEAKIALGTRSAVFAPMDDIGLIVIDEEQEHTYKSEQSPRFHTRDVARFRSAYHKCVCLLSSATPSIESFSAAKAGKYTLCSMSERYGNAVLPQVISIDMRSEKSSGNNGNISMLLAEELQKTIDDKKQAILLLNRRGYNTYIACPSCGYVASCKNCSISMTYHSASNRLLCHYCGHSEPYNKKCPSCGNEHMHYSGAGTQLLEDELKLLLPTARVLRLDADTTLSKNAFSDKLSAFANGEYDILIGTQMVAKGLNFPNVVLVGVLSADQSMYSEDFRGFEKTFSLLTQVVGRSGRGEFPGKAYIQTLSPDSNVIRLAAKQDYEAFYNDEILTRKLMVYPPYCDIVAVTASSLRSEMAAKAANKFVEIMTDALKGEFSDNKVIILRPTPTAVPRVNNKYRYRIIIKCKNNKRLRDLLRFSIDTFNESSLAKGASLSIDVNPDTTI